MQLPRYCGTTPEGAQRLSSKPPNKQEKPGFLIFLHSWLSRNWLFYFRNIHSGGLPYLQGTASFGTSCSDKISQVQHLKLGYKCSAPVREKPTQRGDSSGLFAVFYYLCWEEQPQPVGLVSAENRL